MGRSVIHSVIQGKWQSWRLSTISRARWVRAAASVCACAQRARSASYHSAHPVAAMVGVDCICGDCDSARAARQGPLSHQKLDPQRCPSAPALSFPFHHIPSLSVLLAGSGRRLTSNIDSCYATPRLGRTPAAMVHHSLYHLAHIAILSLSTQRTACFRAPRRPLAAEEQKEQKDVHEKRSAADTNTYTGRP